MAFLYTSKEISEKRSGKKIPITIAIIKLKYLRINLNKEVYSE